MRDYSKITPDVWMREDLSHAARYLYLYLLSNPHSNWIGCYHCPEVYICDDLGMELEESRGAFGELSSLGLVRRIGRFVLLPQFLATNSISNTSMAASRIAELEQLPDGQAKYTAAQLLLEGVEHLSDEQRERLTELAARVSDTPAPRTKEGVRHPKTDDEKGCPTPQNETQKRVSGTEREKARERGRGNSLAAAASAKPESPPAQALPESPLAPPEPAKLPTFAENSTSTESPDAPNGDASMPKTAGNASSIPLPPQPRKSGQIRQRNELLDALVSATGGDPLAATQTALKAAGVALAEIKTVCPELTPQIIDRAAKAYTRAHRDWPLTPHALAKNWHTLGAATTEPKADPLDPYRAPPPNWRRVMTRVMGLTEGVLDDRRWEDMDTAYRRETLREIHKS